MSTQTQESRATRIGASDVSSIIGINPFGNAYEVWLEKKGKLNPWPGNKSTDAGKRFEAGLLDEAEHQLGTLERDVLLYADLDFPLSATLDGRTADGIPVECKTTGLTGPVYGNWGDEYTDEVPDCYLVQCLVQMLCAKSDMCHLFALIGGRGIVRYMIPRDDDIIEVIVSKCRDWWTRYIIGNETPPIENPPSLEVCKRIKRIPDKTIELPESVTGLIEQWETSKAEKKVAEEKEESLKSRLILSLGDADGGYLKDGRLLSFMEQTKKEFISKQVTFRVLRVKKRK